MKNGTEIIINITHTEVVRSSLGHAILRLKSLINSIAYILPRRCIYHLPITGVLQISHCTVVVIFHCIPLQGLFTLTKNVTSKRYYSYLYPSKACILWNLCATFLS